MVIEERSVIAAASKGAKISRIRGGFEAKADESYSIGQIQVLDTDINSAIKKIQESSKEILTFANSKSNTLSKMNKGAKEVSCKEINTPLGKMLIVELLIDVGDAMGANVTNTMCEAVSPLLEKITGGRTLLRILSNYSTRRIAKATAVFDKKEIGENVVDNIILAYQFADNDVYRAVTHNKGIMNGVIAVANATGQDSRAIEAAANAYAARSGQYRSLSKWTKDNEGNLVGTLELPLSVGIVGGIANVHPIAKMCSADYCGNQYKIYIPGISNISMGVTDVTGMLVTTRTMLPRPGLIVRMAEVICDDTPQLTEQHAHVGALKHPGMYEQSVRDGLVCVFVLDKEHSPGAITDDKGIFYVEDIPYRKYGYVPMVIEGDPEFFPVYVFLDDDGNTLVLDLVGGLLDIGTFQTDL